MTLYHPRPARWPQITLKGMLVAVALLSVPFGWLDVQMKWVKARQEAINWMRTQPIEKIAYTGPAGDGWGVPNPTPPWSIRMLGAWPVAQIMSLGDLRPTDPYTLDELKALFPEAKILKFTPDEPEVTRYPIPEKPISD